jgi:hypothetical protein
MPPSRRHRRWELVALAIRSHACMHACFALRRRERRRLPPAAAALRSPFRARSAHRRFALLHTQAVAYFWADWSEPCKQMDAVVQELSKKHPAVAFLRVRGGGGGRARRTGGSGCMPRSGLPSPSHMHPSLVVMRPMQRRRPPFTYTIQYNPITQVEAEKVDELTERFAVETVPCFVLLQVNPRVAAARTLGTALTRGGDVAGCSQRYTRRHPT